MIAFGLAVVFVFLLLAALYESWLLPLAVVLIVPMCILAAMLGVNARGLDRNILVEIGLVVLVGLAAKNAILIVEFARQAEVQGMDRFDAAVAAARTRLRPILMTSLAFILGVVPLAVAVGAGAEMRQSLGTAVFAGMLGVTLFGLVFTPVFYVLSRRVALLFERATRSAAADAAADRRGGGRLALRGVGGGSGGAGGRLRRSAMNWSNSALSLAKRSRSRKLANSFCSSSSRRSVSARYSSKAWLPLDAGWRSRSPPHQKPFHAAHGGGGRRPASCCAASRPASRRGGRIPRMPCACSICRRTEGRGRPATRR